MRIATWNVNSLRVRLPQLLDWLRANPLDVVALQETKVPDGDFPHAELEAVGLHAACSGQRGYNGVALLARSRLEDVVTGIPGFADDQRRVIAATRGATRIIDVYVPNGQSLDSEKYVYKLRWLEALRAWLGTELSQHDDLLLLGDFNIAPEDRDVHDPQAWLGSVHVSEPERGALRQIVDLGLCDVFRNFEQPDGSYSWWDYRAGAFRRNHGLRIDLVLASRLLATKCDACHIDRIPRHWERPSDHAPVVASFDISSG